MEFYRHIPEKLSPILFSIGGFQIRYYGMMYVVAFFVIMKLIKIRVKKNNMLPLNYDGVERIMLYGFFGAVIGARLGYVVFYNLGYFLLNPIEIILPFSFEGGFKVTGISGMSYHGGLVGVIAGIVLFCKKAKVNTMQVMDIAAASIPLGFTFGRIGNFFNGELYGRATESFLGMYFPYARGDSLRHPSQLYQAFFEGIFLFVILWFLANKKPPIGVVSAAYIFGYGFVRFFVEFFREPDAHIGFVFLNFSMGQLLCVVMMVVGILLGLWSIKRKKLA